MKPTRIADGSNGSLTRRDFLKRVGAGVAAAMAAHAVAGAVHTAHASEGVTEDTPAVLIDLTRCIGCNSCALACKAENNLPNPESAPTGLSNEAFTFVSTIQLETPEGETLTRHAKRQCMHCLNPACVSACPAAAMYRSPEGPIVYRAERCLGCRYCQIACPFDVPAFDWGNPLTPVISKCWLCRDRLNAGEQPACVAACPTGALRFGTRRQLLAQAHALIASNPDRYVDHVFGEHEVGGTSMLYVSDIPFAELGFPADLPHSAPPEETAKVMEALPAVILGMGALAAGTATYTHRRSAAHDTPHAHHGAAEPPPADERMSGREEL